jgi:hypothetical protein
VVVFPILIAKAKTLVNHAANAGDNFSCSIDFIIFSQVEELKFVRDGLGELFFEVLRNYSGKKS